MDIDLEIASNKSWTDQVNVAKPIALHSSNAQLAQLTSTFPQSNPTPSVTFHSNAHKHTASPPNTPTIIPYDINQPVGSFLWDGNFGCISIFGTKLPA